MTSTTCTTMNPRRIVAFLSGIALVIAAPREGPAQLALGTAFTHQGSLVEGGSPANGAFDFQFDLRDDPSAGNLLGTVTADDVVVARGVFTATLDFGAQFDGNRRWLEIGVRPGADAGPGGFIALAPRVELAPAPHAIFALRAGHAATADSATTAASASSAANATTADDADLLDGMDSSEFDSDATNELNTGLALSGTEIRIGDAGGTLTLELASLQDGVDDADADPTNEIDDRPPIAVLEANRRTVVVGSAIQETEVSFDLSLSYDPEGETPEYGFDPEGTTSGQPTYSASATATHAYTAGGVYLAEGWVRDSAGQYDVGQTVIEATEGGAITVDATGDVGSFLSLAVVNDRPAIAYYDATNLELKYIRANDADGASWSDADAVVVDTGSVGQYCSMAVVNGNPAIAYKDSANGTLKFARAADANGASWSAVTAATGLSSSLSLAVVNGHPAIAFQSGTTVLQYTRADDADGATWTTVVTPPSPSANPVGYDMSLTTVDGNPAFSFTGATAGRVYFVRASDADGTSWPSSTTVLSSGNGADETSLVVVNGLPSIATYKESDGSLRYARASTADGTGWSNITVDDANNVGLEASMAVINGRPAIAYYDTTSDDLKYASADDADGTTWSTIVIVDSPGNVGLNASLALVNGSPAIAYHDTTNDDLKYAR